MDKPPGGRIKGTAFKGILRSLTQLRGAQDAQRCMDACPDHLRHALSYGQLVSGGWYPSAWYAQLHQAIAATLGTGEEFAGELSARATHEDLHTIYRLASALFSPQTLLRQSMRLMRMYFDGGHVEVTALAAGTAQVRFSGFEAYNRLCWADITAGLLECLRCAGAVAPVARVVRGGGDGQPDLDLSLAWNEK